MRHDEQVRLEREAAEVRARREAEDRVRLQQQKEAEERARMSFPPTTTTTTTTKQTNTDNFAVKAKTAYISEAGDLSSYTLAHTLSLILLRVHLHTCVC